MIIFFSRWLGLLLDFFSLRMDLQIFDCCQAVEKTLRCCCHGFAVSKISCFERLDVLCLGSLGSKTRKDSKWCTSRLDHATFWMIHPAATYLDFPHPTQKTNTSLHLACTTGCWMVVTTYATQGFFASGHSPKNMPANSLPVGSIDIWGFQRSGALGQMLETCRLLLKGLRWALRWTDEDGLTYYIYIFVGWIPSLKPNITYLLKILEGVVVVWNIFYFFDMGIKVI